MAFTRRKVRIRNWNYSRNLPQRKARDAARTPVITELDLIKKDFYEDFDDLEQSQETKDKKNLS